MKKLIYLLFLLFAGSVYSQMDTTKWQIMSITATDTIWMQKPNAADVYRDNGDFKMAILEYNKFIKKDPKEVTNYYSVACIYSLQQNKDSAFKYLAITLKKRQHASCFLRS